MWRVVAEDYGSPLIHVSAYYTASTGLAKPLVGKNDADAFFVFRQGHWKMVVSVEDWEQQGKRVLERLRNRAYTEGKQKKGKGKREGSGMKYKSIAEDHGSPMVHFGAYMSAATGLVKPLIGANDAPGFFLNGAGRWQYVAKEGDWDLQGKRALEAFDSKDFFERTVEEQKRTCALLDEMGYRFRDEDFSTYSNEELAGFYRTLFAAWQAMNVWGHVINLSDFEHFMLTHKMMAFLEKRREENGVQEPTAELFSVLTTSSEKSPFQQHDTAFLRLAQTVQENEELGSRFEKGGRIESELHSFPEFEKALDGHVRRYDWLQYHYDGPTILDQKYFLELLKSELKQGLRAEAKLEEWKRKEEELAKRQKELQERLQLDAEELHWVRLAQSFSYLKGLRKDIVFRTSRNVEKFLEEIGKRVGVSLELARYLTLEEAEELLLHGRKANPDALEERRNYSVFYYEEGSVSVYVGKEAKRFEGMVAKEEKLEEVRELKGTPACAGFVRGIVKLVAKAEDMPKMSEGDILVSPATNPNLVPAMKKAAAIVTDEGGITCHAAIVSRELGIPCVVGTRKATKVFKDGDEVEVDATKGIVRKIGKVEIA